MSTQHTPGPWRVESNTTLIWGECNANDSTGFGMGFPIAEARRRLPSWESARFRLDEDIAEANARLIAAAPDMLAALRPFANVANDRDLQIAMMAGMRPAERGSFQDALAAVVAAIAKATTP